MTNCDRIELMEAAKAVMKMKPEHACSLAELLFLLSAGDDQHVAAVVSAASTLAREIL